jgi:hypothetical protein
MKYFGDSGRYQQVANLFEKLSAREPEVASLLAKSYIGMSMYYIDPSSLTLLFHMLMGLA